MDKKILDFCTRLSRNNAPAFLLLGQQYLHDSSGKDLFLETILSKYIKPPHKGQMHTYFDLFTSEINQDQVSARTWISERANRIPIPSWLAVIADFAWSGVYTSTFETLLSRAFRSDWRSVQPLCSPRLHPQDPRNRSRLHISYLFGSIEQDDPDQRSPLDELEFFSRKLHATTMISRLKEQLTPFGTLAIEGYAGDADWLSQDILLSVLASLEPGQAYYFGSQGAFLKHPLMHRIIAEGKLTLIEESLASVISQGVASGVIQLGSKSAINPSERSITHGRTPIRIPNHIWSQTSRIATILTDADVARPPSLSLEKKYTEFRSFLSDSGNHPIWRAYTLGLQFTRDYEHTLYELVRKKIQAGAFSAEPIILHGQTGSGKTVALGALAYKIYTKHQHPILFIGRRTQRLLQADIDSFCQWAEDNGFAATLIIWDGMVDIEQYYFLHKYLLGRGRKFILVGSTYRLDESDEQQNLNASFICAPATLSSEEIPRFKAHLSELEENLGAQFDQLLQKRDNSFLVALYRLLPETRAQVRHGLNYEASEAEIKLRYQSESLTPTSAQTTLSAALQKAGLLDERKILSSVVSVIGGEAVSAEQELIGLIMVPGRFGLNIPIEILIRAISSVPIANFNEIFQGIDLFRWDEDSLNNIYVGARHPLEAKILVQCRLGGVRIEIEYATRLLKSIRSSNAINEDPELQFAAELVHCLGPNGPENKSYIQYYLELSSTLTAIREDHGVISPRLMLQEASLLRETVAFNVISNESVETRIDLLSKAEKILDEAISLLDNSSRTARLRSMLLVEKASTLGTRMREYLTKGFSIDSIMEVFQHAYSTAMHARSLQPEDFFPIDVIAWCTKDLLSHANLDNKTRYEVIADLFNTFTLCEGDEIGARGKEKLERRRLEFSLLLGDENLKQESLSELAHIGSTAGHYLMAIYLAGELPPSTEPPITSQIARFKSAADYLQSHYSEIKSDGKCLYLLLRYWWSYKSGLAFFPKERATIPFGQQQWKEALNILQSLIALSYEYSNPYLMYLQAVCLWHLGYFDDATNTWRDLQRMSDRVTGRRRVMKTYLASDEQGRPIIYHGTVASLTEDKSKGTVFVEGVRRKVSFFLGDFALEEAKLEEDIGSFHIAFNFIAPTADPVHHYKKAGN